MKIAPLLVGGGYYYASIDGLILTTRDRRGVETGRPRPMYQSKDSKGYPRVTLRVEGERRMFLVARLVCEAFQGPCPAGLECSHLDGNPDNSSAHNIRWETHSENMKRKIRHGTAVIGERHHNNKLSPDEALEIKQLLDRGTPERKIASLFSGIGRGAVRSIKEGRSWAHLQRARRVRS